MDYTNLKKAASIPSAPLNDKQTDDYAEIVLELYFDHIGKPIIPEEKLQNERESIESLAVEQMRDVRDYMLAEACNYWLDSIKMNGLDSITGSSSRKLYEIMADASLEAAKYFSREFIVEAIKVHRELYVVRNKIHAKQSN